MHVPDRLPARTFLSDLPQTKPVKVLELSLTDVFASPAAIVNLDDPDGLLSTQFLLVPTHIPSICFYVSDDRHGYYFQTATVIVQEIEADRTLSLLLSSARSDVRRVPVERTD